MEVKEYTSLWLYCVPQKQNLILKSNLVIDIINIII